MEDTVTSAVVTHAAEILCRRKKRVAHNNVGIKELFPRDIADVSDLIIPPIPKLGLLLMKFY